MERPINSDSTVTQPWSPITRRNPEDGGDMFSETSVRTRTTRYKVAEVICKHQSMFLPQCQGPRFATLNDEQTPETQ
jgi:hypothetical protein